MQNNDVAFGDAMGENDELDESDIIFNFTQRLESCKTHKVDDINNSYSDMLSEHMSIFFQNIDGAKSNFDSLLLSLERFNKKFPIIALAETNICPKLGELFQITDYEPMYQDKQKTKIKELVLLYISIIH